VNGKWVEAQLNGDLGQAFILQGGKDTFEIRVTDANGKLIQNGHIYTFSLSDACKNNCSANVTEVSYTVAP